MIVLMEVLPSIRTFHSNFSAGHHCITSDWVPCLCWRSSCPHHNAATILCHIKDEFMLICTICFWPKVARKLGFGLIWPSSSPSLLRHLYGLLQTAHENSYSFPYSNSFIIVILSGRFVENVLITGQLIGGLFSLISRLLKAIVCSLFRVSDAVFWIQH